MKKYIILATLACVSTLAYADLLIDGGSSSTFDVDAQKTFDLTDSVSGLAPTVASGETLSIQFKVTVNSTTNSLAPDWSNNNYNNMRIGFGNTTTTQAVGVAVKLYNGAAKVRNGEDTDSSSAGTFGLSSGASTTGTGFEVGANGRLNDIGDVAYFTYTIENTGLALNTTMVMSDAETGGTATTVAYTTTGITAGSWDAVDWMGFRPDNNLAANTPNITVEVIPEPATLGLIAMFGVGLIGVRRLFMIG